MRLLVAQWRLHHGKTKRGRVHNGGGFDQEGEIRGGKLIISVLGLGMVVTCRGLGGVWGSRDKKYRGELGTRIAGQGRVSD